MSGGGLGEETILWRGVHESGKKRNFYLFRGQSRDF